MKKTIKELWQDVVDCKAVAINEENCSVNGEAALFFSPYYGDWKICYLDRIESYYLSDGVVKEGDYY